MLAELSAVAGSCSTVSPALSGRPSCGWSATGVPHLCVILRRLADLGDDGDALCRDLHAREQSLAVRSRALLRAAAALDRTLAKIDAAGAQRDPDGCAGCSAVRGSWPRSFAAGC